MQKDGNYGEESIISDKKTLNQLASIFDEIKWEKGTIPSMARKGDVKAVLFYEVEKDMPEKLYEYEIWFNENGKAEFLGSDKDESYGTLNKDKSKLLKKLLVNKQRDLLCEDSFFTQKLDWHHPFLFNKMADQFNKEKDLLE